MTDIEIKIEIFCFDFKLSENHHKTDRGASLIILHFSASDVLTKRFAQQKKLAL